jgi:predicted nucleotidyltransferase
VTLVGASPSLLPGFRPFASDIIDFLSSHKEKLKQCFGVTSIGLFGSYARAETREDSDIDLVVEMWPDHKSLRNFFGLRRYLEEELGRAVDPGIERTLKPQSRDEVCKETIHV